MSDPTACSSHRTSPCPQGKSQALSTLPTITPSSPAQPKVSKVRKTPSHRHHRHHKGKWTNSQSRNQIYVSGSGSGTQAQSWAWDAGNIHNYFSQQQITCLRKEVDHSLQSSFKLGDMRLLLIFQGSLDCSNITVTIKKCIFNRLVENLQVRCFHIDVQS